MLTEKAFKQAQKMSVLDNFILFKDINMKMESEFSSVGLE